MTGDHPKVMSNKHLIQEIRQKKVVVLIIIDRWPPKSDRKEQILLCLVPDIFLPRSMLHNTDCFAIAINTTQEKHKILHYLCISHSIGNTLQLYNLSSGWITLFGASDGDFTA